MGKETTDHIFTKELLLLAGIAAVFFYIGIFLPLRESPTCQNSKVVRRQSNMRMIATAMRNYVADHDGQPIPPERWHEFVDPYIGAGADDPVYFPDYDSQFYLLPIPWADHQLPNGLDDRGLSMVPFLVAEQDLEEGWTSVAFWDGSVRLLSNEEFEQLIDAEHSVCLACEFGTDNWLKKREP